MTNPVTNPLTELLSDSTRGVGRAQGVLCYLFRQAILWGKPNKRGEAQSINTGGWSKRARKFFKKEHNKIYNNDMGNLNKDLTKDEFTWPTFVKAVDFLDPLGASLTIEFTWYDETTSSYTIAIDPVEDTSATNLLGNEEPALDDDVFNSKKPPVNAVARLWRNIIRGEKIDAKKWNKLLTKYVEEPISGIDLSTTSVNEARNTVHRHASSPTLTWSMLRKNVNILDQLRTRYILELRWSEKPGDVSIFQGTVFNPKYNIPQSSSTLKRAKEND